MFQGGARRLYEAIRNRLRGEMTTEVATVESIAPTPPSQPMMALRSITKKFPGLVANDAVDLDIFGGEVHAVLGENGAGKSTLMKVAYGFYRADSGEVQLNGQTVKIRTPYDARRLNIGMVFQNFTLIPAFSVAENIALFLRDLPLLMDKKKIAREIEELSNRFGFSIDPNQLAGRLSIGEQQKVEVLKLLLAGARLLVFDEPTSVLPPHEVDGLLQVFDRLKESGFAVIFITHKLDEVLRSADRITVMRKGTVSGTMLVGAAAAAQAGANRGCCALLGATGSRDSKLERSPQLERDRPDGPSGRDRGRRRASRQWTDRSRGRNPWSRAMLDRPEAPAR
ncbi:MAG: ATP-binding cassette domain-containing protein [Chloroflexi bacterium]|nr:MAG: ATP-binding cassette domain-containing protein [Chloroflexota bacterium]